tara:strand:+ start:1707 stop:2135 length:429 start_codon:yes stop_codon:yes gene_type:complete
LNQDYVRIKYHFLQGVNMNVNIQTIINVCFAISITAFIYTFNQQNEEIETLKGYAQLDSDKTFDRLEAIETKLNMIQLDFDLKNDDIVTNTKNIDIAIENLEVLFSERDRLLEQSNKHTEYINFDNERWDKLMELMDDLYGN